MLEFIKPYLDSVFADSAKIALCSAITVSIAGLIIAIVVGVRHKKVTVPFVLTVFVSLFCFYFVMVEKLTFPKEARPDIEGMGIVTKLFVTMYYSLKPYILDGNFAEVREWLNANATLEGKWLSAFENTLLALYVLAPLSVASAILAMVKGFFSRIRLYFIVGVKPFIGSPFRFLKWIYRLAVQKYKKHKAKKESEEGKRQYDEENLEFPTIYFQDCTWKGFGNIYVFSELNNKSLALAKDIKKTNRFSTFVFYDVYEKNEESFAELHDEAQKIGAIMFRKDILSFSTLGWKIGTIRRVEFFLIGTNESENVSQAIALTDKYKSRYNTQIFVWAQNPESAAILDSINKVDDTGKNKKNIDVDNPYGFKLRRIDDIEIYVWNVLKDANLFIDKNGKRRTFISLLIVGMGDYGMHLLKTAVWMYQMEGIRLEINTLDLTDKTRKRLDAECPELLKKNNCNVTGEARYNIRIFDNVDVFENDVDDECSFRRLLTDEVPADSDLADRLRKTTDIFVALGEDDLNIRAAMELRRLFDQVAFKRNFPKIRDEYNTALNRVKKTYRLRRVSSTKSYTIAGESKGNFSRLKYGKEPIRAAYIARELSDHICGEFGSKIIDMYDAGCPRIFTQVYDQLKSQNIMRDGNCVLETYDNKKSFEIQFRGSFGDQYKYDVITRKDDEQKAIPYHLRWSWSKRKENKEEFLESKKKYNQYEYFRHSSMAQSFHKDMVETHFADVLTCKNDKGSSVPETIGKQIEEMEKKDACMCEACCKSRRVEHMRWNAYMRSEGYCLPLEDGEKYKIKLTRAKYHYQLIPYDRLHPDEQKKDATIRKFKRS